MLLLLFCVAVVAVVAGMSPAAASSSSSNPLPRHVGIQLFIGNSLDSTFKTNAIRISMGILMMKKRDNVEKVKIQKADRTLRVFVGKYGTNRNTILCSCL